jgi:hypothetical protein
MTFPTQLSLVAAVATLVGLGTLIEERRRSVHVLSERLRFEQLLFEFARTFVQVSGERMDAECNEWLERIECFMTARDSDRRDNRDAEQSTSMRARSLGVSQLVMKRFDEDGLLKAVSLAVHLDSGNVR